MAFFIRAKRISRYNMRMLTENARILTVMLIVFLFIVQNLSSVLLFSKAVNIPVTPYAFVFLINDYICQFIIMAGAVMLFSNAPFEDEGYIYMLPRAGRISWAVGQMLYIVKLSLLYIGFLMITTVLYKGSPVSLAQLETYSGYALKWGIDLNYGIHFFAIGIVLLLVMCLISNNENRMKRYIYLLEKIIRRPEWKRTQR